MSAAGQLGYPLKAATYETLIGLLACTGMRVGEAIRLDRGHVDLDGGVITVWHSKFGKSRRLPLKSSVVEALVAYADRRDQLCLQPQTDGFFVSLWRTRLNHSVVNLVFRQLVTAAGIGTASRTFPVPHDLRHSFAISVLLDWYRQGVDVGARLPTLSTYLGHSAPSSTYWYLQAAPELLALTAQRLEPQL
jgi:integrase